MYLFRFLGLPEGYWAAITAMIVAPSQPGRGNQGILDARRGHRHISTLLAHHDQRLLLHMASKMVNRA